MLEKYLSIFVFIYGKAMTENTQNMTQLISDAQKLIGKMEARYEINEKQYEAHSAILDKRVDVLEKAWKTFRNIFITIFIAVIAPIISGGIIVKSDLNQIKKEIGSEDYLETQEAINITEEFIEHNSDMFKEAGVPEESVKSHNERIKSGITRAINTSRSTEIKE